MAGSTLSTTASQAYLDFLLKGSTAPQYPSSLYVALFTTIPSLSGSGGVEVSTNNTGYARIELPRTNTTWTGPTGSGQEYNNTSEIVFGLPTANWGTIQGMGIYDASASGNLIFISTISTAKSVNLGDGQPRILAGQLKISRASC